MADQKKAMLRFIGESERVAMALARTPKAKQATAKVFEALRYGVEHDDDAALEKLAAAAAADECCSLSGKRTVEA